MEKFNINGKDYERDSFTNITPRIISKMNKRFHVNNCHPLGIIMARIKEYFYQNYRKATGTPLYSIYDNLDPIVSVKQNFEDLLIPENHVSRRVSDTYYINSDMLLRGHTSAHEADLIRSGLDAFLIAGDVYRRDEIDSSHYPVFHQVEGVRLFTKFELFNGLSTENNQSLYDDFLLKIPSLRLETELRCPTKQERHGEITSQLLEHHLKQTLEKLATYLFGKEINYRWVPAFFPWTHPSYELELEIGDGLWMEMLGCGILEQDMLDKSGAIDRVGFAFGLGLERWAMKLFDINDIRVFWSNDKGVTNQFHCNDVTDIHRPIKYKPVSSQPPCNCDISFWLPESHQSHQFHENDFYELVGAIGGDMVERVQFLNSFTNGDNGRVSNCYRIVYRHMSQNLTKKQVNVVHDKIAKALHTQMGCEVR